MSSRIDPIGNEMIYKTAEEANLMSFLNGAVNEVSDKVNFAEKPFATIFSTFGTSIAFSINPLLGLFVLGLELTGDTLSSWGSKIDNALGFGKGKVPSMPSNEQIDSVAMDLTNKVIDKEDEGSFIDKLYKYFGLNESKAMLLNLKEIKGEISENDIIVSLSYAQYKSNLIKVAGIGSWLKALLGFAKSENKHSLIFNIVRWFFKIVTKFISGVLLLGAGGGIVGYTGYKKDTGTTTTTSQIDEKTSLYKNTKGNVKNTVIDFLNSEFDFNDNGKKISFSEMFKKQNNRPIENSTEMNELLFKIQLANGGESINNISRWESFKAPNLKSMYNDFFSTPPVESVKPVESAKPQVAEQKKPTNNAKLSKRDNNLEEISNLLKSMKG